jgi:hypothetical protein
MKLKSFEQHMSEQNSPSKPIPIFDKWVGIIFLSAATLWILRWPVLFIVYLVTGGIK